MSYFLNLQSQSSSNMARLMLEDRYVRLDPDIEDWDLDDTKHLDNLKALADRDFTQSSEDIMNSMRRRKSNIRSQREALKTQPRIRLFSK